jgi:hypothetical protein
LAGKALVRTGTTAGKSLVRMARIVDRQRREAATARKSLVRVTTLARKPVRWMWRKARKSLVRARTADVARKPGMARYARKSLVGTWAAGDTAAETRIDWAAKWNYHCEHCS